MDLLVLNLQAIGISQILLALFHLSFEKQFDWKEDLDTISLLNRQLMYVHTFFVAFAVFLNGLLSLFATRLLLEPSTLTLYILLGLSIFWLARLYVQFFVFDKTLWIGQGFNTVVHVVFGMVWLWYSATYLFLSWWQWQALLL